MATRTEQLLRQLEEHAQNDDFLVKTENIVEELRSCDDASLAVAPLLRLIEENPSVDYGMPGPIVHFVESFFRNGYEDELLESIRRKPTVHTVWMLNRIINGVKGEEKEVLLAEMANVAKRGDIEESVRNKAARFCNFQASLP